MIDEDPTPAPEPTPVGAPPETGRPTDGVTAAASEVEPRKASRRNYAVMCADYIGSFTGFTFFMPHTILQEFATHLTRSNVLVGMMTSIVWAGGTVTQLAATGFVERLPIKKWFLVIVVGIMRLPLLVLAILTPILADSRPTVMLMVLYGVLTVHSLLDGCAWPPYAILYSKVIPARQRGTLYGFSGTVSNVLRIGTGLFIPFVLTSQHRWGGFPNGFALCFVIGFVILFASYLPLVLTDEPRDEVLRGRSATRDYTRAIRRILRHDRDFQYFAVFGCFSAYARCGSALYVTYSLRELGAPEGESGWFTVIIAVGAMVSLFWGRLADRSDNRTVLVLASVLAAVAPVWALFAPSRFWFYPVVFLTAVAGSGLELAGINMQLEFSAPAHAARYVALFAASQFLPRLTAPLAAGAVADALGFKAVFVMAGLSGIVSLAVISRMRDPRGRVETVESG